MTFFSSFQFILNFPIFPLCFSCWKRWEMKSIYTLWRKKKDSRSSHDSTQNVTFERKIFFLWMVDGRKKEFPTSVSLIVETAKKNYISKRLDKLTIFRQFSQIVVLLSFKRWIHKMMMKFYYTKQTHLHSHHIDYSPNSTHIAIWCLKSQEKSWSFALSNGGLRLLLYFTFMHVFKLR